jgi:hypothetical protein
MMSNRNASFKPRASVTALTHSRLLSALVLLCSIFASTSAEEIPPGFKPERYAQLWKRNPFTLVTPEAPRARPSPFDNLFLTSWLRVGATEVIFVQNSETNETEKITTEPNQKNLRIVEFHMNPNPHLVEAIISDGKEQGIVKFKFDVQAPALQTASASNPPANPGTPAQGQTSRLYPGIARIPNGESNSEGSRFYPRIPRITNAEGSTEGVLRRARALQKPVEPDQTSNR